MIGDQKNNLSSTMTMQEATFHLLKKLRGIYPDAEAGNITDWVLEKLTGSKKTERMLYKNELITAKEEEQLQDYIRRLSNHEPVQYVLNECWFCGLKMYVDENVLIPRPETEELVEWIISGCKFPINQLSILDIGTGSGCIALALKKRLGKALVSACDLSEKSLEVAKRNASNLGIDVHFSQLDFLDAQARDELPSFDIIVSNPPYITAGEKDEMRKNVVDYEPASALFVPDDDALVFYKAIAAFGKGHLNPGGNIYVEINEELGPETASVFTGSGYQAETKKDMQGKDRMIRAYLP